MESTYRKRRYKRYDRYGKNKKNKREEDFVQNIMKQIAACCVIFLIIFALKSIRTPMTNSAINKIKSILLYTVDINGTYKSVATFANNLGSSNKDSIKINSEDIPKDIIDSKEVGGDSIPSFQEESVSNGQSKIEGHLEGKLDLEMQGKVDSRVQNPPVKINQDIFIPLDGVVTSKFGMRKHPLFEKELFHTGIDIDGEKGADIVAAMDGQVDEVGYNDQYGNYVKLKHKDNIYTFYGHCSKIMVKKGQQVDGKTTIAKVGDLGIASGAHLHFEILHKDKLLDPLEYLDLKIDPNMTAE